MIFLVIYAARGFPARYIYVTVISSAELILKLSISLFAEADEEKKKRKKINQFSRNDGTNNFEGGLIAAATHVCTWLVLKNPPIRFADKTPPLLLAGSSRFPIYH